MSDEPAHVSAVVDHDLCVGAAQCIRVAPGAFALDADGMSVFAPHGPWSRHELEDAADACPMAAIAVTAALR